MYKSPIELYTTDLQTKINEHADGVIMEAVKGIGVDVNKEELIRALQYDRHQYEKGYADGMKEFAERVKPIIDEILDIMFDDAESKCVVENCKKPSSISCESELCIDENKEVWKMKIDNLLKEMEMEHGKCI